MNTHQPTTVLSKESAIEIKEVLNALIAEINGPKEEGVDFLVVRVTPENIDWLQAIAYTQKQTGTLRL
jgi:hypothetical protein